MKAACNRDGLIGVELVTVTQYPGVETTVATAMIGAELSAVTQYPGVETKTESEF